MMRGLLGLFAGAGNTPPYRSIIEVQPSFVLAPARKRTTQAARGSSIVRKPTRGLRAHSSSGGKNSQGITAIADLANRRQTRLLNNPSTE
jgi:hypothetical protein